MGSTSSIEIKTENEENVKSDRENTETFSEENAVVFEQKDVGVETRQDASRVQANHSFSMEPDRVELNVRSKSNLNEENTRLLLENEPLTNTIKTSTEETRQNETLADNCSRDSIFGESTEQKLFRLEKHLASERQEKWLAIERGERTRVDLVNCERELAIANQKLKNLVKELEEKKSVEKSSKEIVEEDKIGEVEGDEETPSSRRNSLSKFKADLTAKRQARQAALAAITAEMNGLREELQREKFERRKLERELESFKDSERSLDSVISDNNSLRNEIDILTENVERLNNVSSENIRLKCEAKRLNAEMDSLNLNLGELKFEYYEEKRKHERTIRRLEELESNSTEADRLKNDWEEEKEKFFEKYDQKNEAVTKRTNALKEVIAITRQMLAIRESQVQELKTQLKDIEESVKKTKIMEENGLKAEYEKQLENIKNLKELYEERVRLMESERQKLDENVREKTKIIKDQVNEIEHLQNEVEASKQETKFEKQENESMDRELRLTIAKCNDLENELSLINNMFTQMLLGPFNTGNETDLDKLTELLQENHALITEMTSREDSSEIASVLPKLLLDLITQVDGNNEHKDEELSESCDTISEQSESMLVGQQGAVLPILSYKDATLFKSTPKEIDPAAEQSKQQYESKFNEQVSPAVQEIASNLPKVWKVLMELLSHHSVPEEPTSGDEKQCYKKVDTPNGPRTVISVSKTFIRLKDLILEKKALQKELTRLKQLNLHLENRLDDQEKRLSHVQCELHKTWGIVGRMRAQHQQLHNHEKILRYELQEKRVMLSELKQELEYCREKWERARQKNHESETEWKKLRREFAARKSKGCKPSSLNDSGESGFSDEQNESGDDSDTERSGTESPVDQILVEEEEEEKGAATAESKVETNYSVPSTSNFIEELIKQSEQNLKQTTENLEETKLEECEEVNKVLRTISRARESGQTDDREKAREARDLRLKRLEEQCKLLVRQVDITKHKSNYLNTRLEELHEQYTTSENNRIRNKAGTSSQTMTTEEDDEGTTNDETDQQQTSSESDNQSNEFSKSDGAK